jgi:hypothetical protein
VQIVVREVVGFGVQQRDCLEQLRQSSILQQMLFIQQTFPQGVIYVWVKITATSIFGTNTIGIQKEALDVYCGLPF